MYSAREAGYLATAKPENFENLTRFDLEDICGNMLFSLPEESWRKFITSTKALDTKMNVIIEYFIKNGVFAHKELSEQTLEKFDIRLIERLKALAADRVWNAAVAKFDESLSRGDDRDVVFNEIFSKYLLLCHTVEISDPFFAKGLTESNSAARWLIENQLIPAEKNIELHSLVFGDWRDIADSVQVILDKNPKYNKSLSIRLYYSKDKHLPESGRLFHDRHLVFRFSKGTIPVCLGNGADTFAVDNEGPNKGKLVGNAQIYSSSPSKYRALLSEQSSALLKYTSHTRNIGSKRLFSFKKYFEND